MVIETILFLAFVTAVGTTIGKIYEWRHDVLYGPYLAKQRSEPNPTAVDDTVQVIE